MRGFEPTPVILNSVQDVRQHEQSHEMLKQVRHDEYTGECV
ncbi:MAG: hypothetical protein ABJN65_16670 [Parasphingorhabdus sp.]